MLSRPYRASTNHQPPSPRALPWALMFCPFGAIRSWRSYNEMMKSRRNEAWAAYITESHLHHFMAASSQGTLAGRIRLFWPWRACALSQGIEQLADMVGIQYSLPGTMRNKPWTTTSASRF